MAHLSSLDIELSEIKPELSSPLRNFIFMRLDKLLTDIQKIRFSTFRFPKPTELEARMAAQAVYLMNLQNEIRSDAWKLSHDVQEQVHKLEQLKAEQKTQLESRQEAEHMEGYKEYAEALGGRQRVRAASVSRIVKRIDGDLTRIDELVEQRYTEWVADAEAQLKNLMGTVKKRVIDDIADLEAQIRAVMTECTIPA